MAAMKPIDYIKLVDNLNEMINLLEYDSMRSAGKCKLNATTITDMYALVDRYTAAAAKPAKKNNTNKEV